MRICLFAVALLTGMFLAANPGRATPVDLSVPGNNLGAADALGYLEIWQEVENVGIELGAGSYLPLRYRFSTESNKRGMLGSGFYVPMFEARNILVREGTMLANLPCGNKIYLWRNASDASKFQSPDGIWQGTLQGDDFTVARADGWQLFYRQGRLASVTSDDNRISTWSYDEMGGGNVSQEGKVIISTEPGTGGQMSAFVFRDKRYKVEFGRRPITQVISGQAVIKDLEPALVRLEDPAAGAALQYEFGLTDERVPKLTVSKFNGSSIEYTWEADNGHIITEKSREGDWTYKIGTITQEFGTPKISRSAADGSIESVSIDNKAGVYTKVAKDGSKIIAHLFKTPGPLYDKTQKVERVKNVDGKEIITQVYRATYDEAGRVIREVDEAGIITKYMWNQKGELQKKELSLSLDPKTQELIKIREANLLQALSQALPNSDVKDEAAANLGYFYIHELLQPAKALEQLSGIANENARYLLSLQIICYDRTLNREQRADAYRALIDRFPDKKDLLTQLAKNP